jgi:hypothetical protein
MRIMRSYVLLIFLTSLWLASLVHIVVTTNDTFPPVFPPQHIAMIDLIFLLGLTLLTSLYSAWLGLCYLRDYMKTYTTSINRQVSTESKDNINNRVIFSRKRRVILLILTLFFLVLLPTTCAYVFQQSTQSITQTIKRQYYYINSLSNDDSSPDVGTHSNFAAQQYGPDSVYDTLTETTNTITFRRASSQISQGPISITIPTGTIQGDVMIANIYCGGSGTITVTPPSGWTLVVQTSVSGQIMETYYKVASDSEPSSYSWSVSGDAQNQGGISTYYNVDTSNPIDAYSNQANPASTSYTAPSVTTTVNNAMLVGAFGACAGGNPNTVTPQSGFTEQYDIGQDSNDNACLESSDYVQASAGASGVTVAIGQSGVNIGHLIALKPIVNYRLDLKEKWSTVNYGEANEILCVYLGSHIGSENIRVDVWRNSAWQNLLPNLSVGWNNVTVSTYLDSPSFTIRFNGGIETGDISQDVWAIDVVLLHVWS